MLADELVSREALDALAAGAEAADTQRSWPEASWEVLVATGATRWAIPPRFAGQGLEGAALRKGSAPRAPACMTTCFLLSEREAACVRRGAPLTLPSPWGEGETIARSPQGGEGRARGASEELREELLVPLARGERFATVGLAQLTTSRQHGKP